MSLITICPACATRFKAVPDQLRIADGWVRCGRCNEIFNASLHLLSHNVVTAAEVEHAADSATMIVGADLPPDAQIVPFATELRTQASDQGLPVGEPVRAFEELAFLHEGRNGSYLDRPKLRALLCVLVGVLLLGLTGQVVFHERNRLLALEPRLEPWLLAFCAPLNCRLSALQHKDSIVIDSAAFTKISRNSYRLNFTVKNTSTMTLAVPSIELTLTDASEQPVLRRVFTSNEFDLRSDTLAAGAEWSASLTMLLNTSDTAPPIVGYRLYVFYV